VRWSPLARDRSRPAQAPDAAPAATKPDGKPRTKQRSADQEQGRNEAYRQERPRRKPRPQEAEHDARGATQKAPREARVRGREQLLQFFAPCPRGLEAELARELETLGAQGCAPGSGGVAFQGDIHLAWKANLWSRLAIRILQQVGNGRYQEEDDLYRAALKLAWPEWFSHEHTIAVRTVAHACPLKSLNFVTLKIKDAVCDRFRQDDLPRPDVDTREPHVPILLYLERDQYTLYLDLTGAPLNRRGYRVDPAPAPLNENLAAGLLKLAGWTPEVPLLDPMMGGGTILLEAALMALNIAPGARRHFSFEHLISFDKVEWARLRKNAQAEAQDKRQLPIYGCDIDPRMVEAAHRNLQAAGLDECVYLDVGDALAIQPPEPTGMLISNPPYGVRLEPDDMTGFYAGLGDALKQRFTGWKAFLLSADPELPKHIGLKSSRRTPLYNGPLECRLFEYELVAGSLHRESGGRGGGRSE